MPTRFPRWKLAVFAVLSVCDFVITYLLLSRSNGEVYEANPVANHWLEASGWLGLAAFKLVMVVVVGIIATYVYYRRPRTAHDLLALACGAAVVVVGSGMTIAFTMSGKAAADDADFRIRSHKRPQAANARNPDYLSLLDEGARQLAANPSRLGQVVASVQSSDMARDPEWIASLRQAYPGIDDRALVAADLIQHTVSMRLRTPGARSLAERLETEFRKQYGVTSMLPYRQILHLAPRATDSPRSDLLSVAPRFQAE